MARPGAPPAVAALKPSPTERPYVRPEDCPRALPNVTPRDDVPLTMLGEIAALAEAAAHNTAVALRLTAGGCDA